MAVGLYITGAYCFTASTSFANPAVTLARVFTNTFAGIRSVDAAGFIVDPSGLNTSSLKSPLSVAGLSNRR